ncbi:hypothetical protein [Arsenicicoccus bolidensis]|uniref:hypothetical protein n=1 Tax=Arsenicicoccus bolidensis TaxID=229480 RepID=UPI0028A69F3B|nr:hypothetical protein [Arsenicicoccus bolidensis]
MSSTTTPATALPRVDSLPAAGKGEAVARTLTSADEATALAHHALAATREHPLVCITTATGHAAPFVDAQQITDDLDGPAEVVIMPTGKITWAFHDALPPGGDVYGGATRIYPPGSDWTHDTRRAPLCYAYGETDRARAGSQIVSAALAMVRTSTPTAPPARPIVAGGHVLGVAGGRALVDISLGSSGQATIWPELIADIDADHLLTAHMPVWGALDLASRRLDVTGMRLDPQVALADYQPGATVLARVALLDDQEAHLELWPGTHATITRSDILPGQHIDPREALSLHEVLPIRLTSTAPTWRATLHDTDAPIPAAPILEGGPAWLEPPATDPGEQPDQSTDPAWGNHPEPATAPTSDADALRLERDELARLLAHTNEQLDREQATTTRLRTELRQAREREARLRSTSDKATEALRVLEADQTLFLSPHEQLRFEVQVAWARRTEPGEKADLPLKSWRLGPDFLSTWDAVHGIDRAKVIDVLVDILTGRAATIPARQMHQLRSSIGGNSAPVVRDDGATCWRVALQTKTPSARRCHFWSLRDGSIELSSIRLHDDLRP